jgi:parallel beta helix pectate lyase-like protein
MARIGATVGANFSEQNGGPGIGLYGGATGNTLDGNQIERNSNNFPTSTACVGCFGGGILLDDGSNNNVTGNHVRNNGTLNGSDNTDGIRLNFPSTGNTIQSNHLRDNVMHDCHDASTGNTWVDNHGETSFPTAGLCDPDPQDAFVAEAGWDPSYPWYSVYDGLATDYDWPSLYSAIDAQIQGLLDLLPQLGVGFVRRPSP